MSRTWPLGGSEDLGASREVRQGRNVGLDILRGLAALAVVARHSYGLGGNIIPIDDRTPKHLLIAQGATGVWLFFVLSGYLVAKPFVSAVLGGGDLQVKDYARRRLSRIFPAFWVPLGVVLAFAGVAATTPKRTILANVLLLHNLLPGTQGGILGVSWTLTLEACFYLFLPVAAWILIRWRRGRITPRELALGVVLLWVASAVWAVSSAFLRQDQFGVWMRAVFPAMICSFCPGILLAVAERDPLLSARWRANVERGLASAWFVVPAVVVLGTLGAYGGTLLNALPLSVASIQCWVIAYGLVVAFALRRPVQSRNVVVRVFTWFGVISYGVYLWHDALFELMAHYKAGVPLTARWIGAGRNATPVPAHPGLSTDLVQFIYLTAISVAVAAVSWYMMEAPLIAWSRRKSRKLAHAEVLAPT